jgi:hypothetical protein
VGALRTCTRRVPLPGQPELEPLPVLLRPQRDPTCGWSGSANCEPGSCRRAYCRVRGRSNQRGSLRTRQPHPTRLLPEHTRSQERTRRALGARILQARDDSRYGRHQGPLRASDHIPAADPGRPTRRRHNRSCRQHQPRRSYGIATECRCCSTSCHRARKQVVDYSSRLQPR